MIDEHGAALTRDLLLFYGVNLVDFVAGRVAWLTPRLLLSLIEQLPEGSAYFAALRGGPEYRDWGLQEYLLAGVINAVNTNTQMTGWFKGAPPKFPIVNGPSDSRQAMSSASVSGGKDASIGDLHAQLTAALV